MAEAKSIYDLKVGDSAQISKIIAKEVINDFARARGHFNPIHLDQSYTEKTSFTGRIAHGLLSEGGGSCPKEPHRIENPKILKEEVVQ